MTQGEAELQYQVSLPLSLRRDETALHARIVEIELECARLRNRVKQLERVLELVRPEGS